MGLNSKQDRKLRNALLCGIGLLWFVALGVGLRTMLNYEYGPATSGPAPGMWPSKSRIQRAPGLPAIVVMAHPRCQCTRATIGESALLGGEKGAAIGAMIGAGAGTGVQAMSKAAPVQLPAKSTLSFRLETPLTVIPSSTLVESAERKRGIVRNGVGDG
jgi:hypothetical protein